jgi:hypothetical protein
MKISELQSLLAQVKRENGDVEVYLSSDSEGNGYSTTNVEHNYWDKDKLVLYPWEENIELTFEK